MSLKIGVYQLVNDEKVENALNGTALESGVRVGGIAKDDGTYDDAELLAHYDKRAGLIKKGTDTVKTGSFWDFKAKRPRKEAEVVFTYRIDGKLVDVPEGAPEPGIVKAARVLAEEEQKQEDTEEKPKKKYGKKTL